MRQGSPLRGSIGLVGDGSVLAVRLRVPFPIVLKDAIKAVPGTRWHASSSSWLVAAEQGATLLLAIHGENFAVEPPALKVLLPLARAQAVPGLAALEALAAQHDVDIVTPESGQRTALDADMGLRSGTADASAARRMRGGVVEASGAPEAERSAGLRVRRALGDERANAAAHDTTAYSDVSFLLARVEAAIAGALPYGEWVVGIAQSVTVTQRGAVYLRLMDAKELAAGGTASALDVAIFGDHARRVLHELQRANLRLEDGMTLALRGQVRIYRAKSAVQLIADSIDVRASRGELELKREQVVAQFRAEGLVGRNTALPMPLLPRAIALVTSGRGDALHDVLRTLEKSQVGALVTCFDVAVQGAHLESTVLDALAQIEAHAERFDLVCIVRGGGAANDLAWWDNVAVGRAIARLSLPVVVGIGHERDQSALHEVARFEATPTAVAAMVGGMWENARGWVAASADVIARQVEGRMARSAQRQHDVESRFAYASARPLQLAGAQIAQRLPGLVAQAARHAMERADAHVARLTTQTRQAGERRVLEEHTALAQVFARVSNEQLRARLARDTTQIDALAERLAGGAGRVLRTAESTLRASGAVVRASDPARIVERGFAIVRRPDGVLVRRIDDVGPGDMLKVSTASGVLHAQVVVPPTADTPPQGEKL